MKENEKVVLFLGIEFEMGWVFWSDWMVIDGYESVVIMINVIYEGCFWCLMYVIDV